jgi:putative membrane protein
MSPIVSRWLLATLHLIALGIGLGALWARARALRARLDTPGALRRVFYADTWWGVAGFLWIATGLIRAFGGFEKGTAYYVHNDFFLTKMALLVVILALEVWPMMTLIRWRTQIKRSEHVRTGAAVGMSRISILQAILVICMVFAATAMARGLGARTP